MSVATTIIDYAKELMKRENADDPYFGATTIIDYAKELMKHENTDDPYIGEVLRALGYKVLSEETEMTRRKHEFGQSDRA